MATSNARIQFSTADEETWKSVNPMLREGELVIAKKPSGKYRLYVGAKGGSKFKDSTIVWDEELADSHEKNAAISADAAMTSKSAAASSASYAAQIMNSAKESASAAEQSMNSAEASADKAAEYMNNAINSSSAAAQNSASAASSMKKAEQSMNSAKENADKAVAASNNASSSASSAANSESNAIDAKNKATQSAYEAKSSELNAKASEKSAANSAAALSYATQEEVNFGTESRKIVSPKTLGTLLNLLQRNTYYKVGEIVYSTKLPSWAYLECTQAGTTGNTEPNLSTVSEWGEVNDGSAKFRVVDKRMKAMIDILYPVGIVVTTATDDALKPGEEDGLTQWEEIASGRGLIGAGTGTDTNDESVSFTAGNTGGEYKHKLTVNELPEHAHAENINGKGNDDWDNKFGSMVSRPNPGTGNTAGYSVDISSNWNTTGHPVMTDETGGNQAHNNMQPYLVVHFWKRIK